MSWWKKCCGQGSDGENPSWFSNPLVMVLLGIAAWGALCATFHLMANRGLSITERSCRSAGDPDAYLVSTTLRNRDPVYTFVTLRVQGRFRGSWPSATVRNQLEAMSQRATVLVEPHAEATSTTRFSLPGLQGFACTASVQITGQQRFTERPDANTLRALR